MNNQKTILKLVNFFKFTKFNIKQLNRKQNFQFQNLCNLKNISHTKSISSLNKKIQYNVYTIHYDDNNQDDVTSLSYSQAVENIIKEFIEALKYKGEKGILIIDALKKLEGAKFGIDMSSPQYKHFIFYIQRHLNKQMPQQEYFQILEGVYYSGITDAGLWGSLISYLRKHNETLSPQTHLRSLYYITDFKITNSLDLYINDKQEQILEQIKMLMQKKQYLDLILALNMAIKCDIQIETQQMMIYLDFLVTHKNIYFPQLDAHFFSNIAFVLFNFIQQSGIEYSSDVELIKLQQNKGDLMVQVLKDSIDCFINMDMVQYDTMLREYEFTEKKTNEIGIFDKTDWASISRIMIIISDPEFYDNETFKRVEDIIYRKSETDVIDVQNAGIMLECYGLLQLDNINSPMLILQMLDARLKAEKEKAKDGYEANVVIRLLEALQVFEGSSLECNQMINTVKYFGGAIKHGALHMNQDQAFQLKLIYEDSPYTQNDPEILKKINEILERYQNKEQGEEINNKEFGYNL